MNLWICLVGQLQRNAGLHKVKILSFTKKGSIVQWNTFRVLWNMRGCCPFSSVPANSLVPAILNLFSDNKNHNLIGQFFLNLHLLPCIARYIGTFLVMVEYSSKIFYSRKPGGFFFYQCLLQPCGVLSLSSMLVKWSGRWIQCVLVCRSVSLQMCLISCLCGGWHPDSLNPIMLGIPQGTYFLSNWNIYIERELYICIHL